MRHTAWTVPALPAVVLLLAVGLAGQSTDSAQAQLRTAMDTAVVDGDLRAAITQYQAIVETFKTDRAVGAAALVQIADLYEKLGDGQFREVYDLVLQDYSDQAEPVAAVRARLAALEVESTPQSLALNTELQWAGARGISPQGDVSPDGSLVTYVDWQDGGNLAIRHLASGENRRLTHTADNGLHSAYNSRVSPDGEQVVYTWQRSSTDPTREATGELRVLALTGDRTAPRTVWSPTEGSWASIQDWFPGGDRVVAVVNSFGNFSIVTVPLVDGPVQQVLSIDWGSDPQVRVSPDGRYLAYSRSASREVPEMDIFLVAVDGSGSSWTAVVQHAANDELVAWSLDGRHLLFNSDRSGQPGLWAQRVQDAEPAGEPQLLVANLDVSAGMGVTRDGTLHYPVRVTRRRMKIAELDLKTGELLGQPVNVTDRFVGSNSGGVFSPDGETLAYVSARRGWTKQAIVIQTLKTGEERDLPHELQRVFRLSWRSDGDRLMVVGQDDRGRPGSFDVNVATGQTRPLTDFPNGGILTPDGTQILHRDATKNPELIYSYNVADGSVQALPGVFSGNRFSLSPDGQGIATLRFTEDGQLECVRSVGCGGGTEIRLHPVVGGDSDVLWTTDEGGRFGRWTVWTPDGTALLVLRSELQAGEYMWRLSVVPVDGSDPVATELLYEPANAGAVPLEIHPDGTRIVYAEGGYFNQFWAVHNLGLD